MDLNHNRTIAGQGSMGFSLPFLGFSAIAGMLEYNQKHVKIQPRTESMEMKHFNTCSRE